MEMRKMNITMKRRTMMTMDPEKMKKRKESQLFKEINQDLEMRKKMMTTMMMMRMKMEKTVREN